MSLLLLLPYYTHTSTHINSLPLPSPPLHTQNTMSNIDQATDPLHQHHHQHHHNASLTTTKSQYSCNTLPVNQAATRLLALSLRETAPTLIATVDLDSKAWVSNRYKDTSLYIFQNRNKHKEKRLLYRTIISYYIYCLYCL